MKLPKTKAPEKHKHRHQDIPKLLVYCISQGIEDPNSAATRIYAEEWMHPDSKTGSTRQLLTKACINAWDKVVEETESGYDYNKKLSPKKKFDIADNWIRQHVRYDVYLGKHINIDTGKATSASMEYAIYTRGANDKEYVQKSFFVDAFEEDDMPRIHTLEVWATNLPKWNGKDHIKKLITYMPVKDKEQAELFLKGWLVRAYRQAVNPKGKDFNSIVNRWFLILAQNRQDTGKSSFLRWLVPDPMWIKESLPRDKDAVIALSRYMFILDDELGALSRPDEMERIKALISTSKVDVRAPYGKVDLSLHRTASFCGSTNSEGIFPSDDTTRFLVLPLSDGTFNWQAYTEKINKAQLWAQVKELETTNWLHANTGAIVKSRVDTNQQYHTETLEMSAVMNHVEIVEDVSAFILQTGDVAVLLADLSNSYQRLNINKLGQALKKVFGHRQAGYLKGGRRSMGYRVKVKP